jgi:hypothetical protein
MYSPILTKMPYIKPILSFSAYGEPALNLHGTCTNHALNLHGSYIEPTPNTPLHCCPATAIWRA